MIAGAYWLRQNDGPWQIGEVRDGVCWFPGNDDPWFLDQAESEGYVIGPLVQPPNLVGQAIGADAGLPRHIALTIHHQPHAAYYQSVEEYLATPYAIGSIDIDPGDRAEMLRTGEIWEIDWHPSTPVGSCTVAAATLERALELANSAEYR